MANNFYSWYQNGIVWMYWMAIIFAFLALFLLLGNLFLLIKKRNKNKSTVRKICDEIGKISWLLAYFVFAYMIYLTGNYGMVIFSIIFIIFGLFPYIIDFANNIISYFKKRV